MRKNHRFAFLAIGGLGLLAAIAPGLAATLTVPTGAAVPAAGQGVAAVQGFTVTDIDWTVENTSNNVTAVRFTITRTSDSSREVNAVVAEDEGDAIVRVRLEASSGTPPAFVSCDVDEGAATCDTSAESATMTAGTLHQVNIIAFDRTPPP